MKKIFLALLIAVTMAACAPCSAMASPDGGGLFQRGDNPKTEQVDKGGIPGLPGHGQEGDQPTPLGAGILALSLMGGAYLLGKKTKENRN